MNATRTTHLWRSMQVVTWIAMIVVVSFLFQTQADDVARHDREDKLDQAQTCEFRKNLIQVIEETQTLEVDPATITDPALHAYAVQKVANRQQYIDQVDAALGPDAENCNVDD